MAAEAVIFAGVILAVISAANRRAKVDENNIKALTDSVEVVKTVNDNLYYEKQALILERNDLEKFLNISKNEVKSLEKQLKSKVAYITEIEGQLEAKPKEVVRDSIIYVDNTPSKYMFDYDDGWLTFNGETVFSPSVKTMLSNISSRIPLTVGLTDDYNIFVKSDNPYVTFSEINGAAVDRSRFAQRPKHFNLGLQVGFGAQYGLMRGNFDYGPYIGVGFAYGFSF